MGVKTLRSPWQSTSGLRPWSASYYIFIFLYVYFFICVGIVYGAGSGYPAQSSSICIGYL